MHTASPAKRQRVDQQAHEPIHVPSFDQTINRSDNQPINQPHSYLSHLLPPLFAIICEYLDLECKCRCLPVLNRSVKLLFNPVACCKGHITVDFKHGGCLFDRAIYDRVLAKFVYAPYASSVRCVFTDIKDQNLDVQSEFRQTMLCVLDNPGLHSLAVRDDSGEANFSMIHLVLTKLAQKQPVQLSRLHALELNVWLAFSPNSKSRLSFDFSGLRNCTSLTTFKFHFQRDRDLELLFAGLPDSLTELTLDSSILTRAALNRKLMCPTFLPHLRRVPRGDDSRQSSHSEELLVGLSTVIPGTGRSRPIEELDMFINTPNLDLNWCSQVHTLQIACDLHFMDALCGVADDVLPLLNSFSFTSVTKRMGFKSDISPVIIFASKRPIKTMEIGAGWFNEEYRLTISPIGLKHLARMSVLTSLTLNELALLSKADICEPGLIPVGCWPQLTQLIMRNIVWNPETAACFIQAVPNLKELFINWSDNWRLPVFSWVPLLPVVAHCCPDIITFSVYSNTLGGYYRPFHEIVLPQLQAGYASWPLAVKGFQRLKVLQIDGFDVDQLVTRWCLSEYSFENCELSVFNKPGGLRFRTLTDVPAVDGRKVFFDLLYCCLEQIEQM